MARLLIVTYRWPPDASVGANRPAKLAQHLAREGWEPLVLTVRERYYSAVNPTSQPTDAAVLRTRMFRNPSAWYGSLKRTFYALTGRRSQYTQQVMSWTAARPSRESLPSRVRRLVLSLLHMPDEFVGWLPFAVVTALRTVWTKRVECVVSTGPPFCAHLVGLVLKMTTGVRWVADFRDPWVANPQKPPTTRSAVSDRLEQWLESLVIRASDRIVCVSPAMTEEYRRRYARTASDKWTTITNGFDAREFEEVGDVQRASKFTLSYTGSLYHARSPETVLQAVADLIADGTFERDEVAVRFVGSCRYVAGRSVAEMITALGLSGVAEIVDAMPRRDALVEMMRSHVLLLLAAEQRLQIPGKTFEYMAAGGHILALTESGATADLVSQVEGSTVCDSADLAAIKQVLRRWYEEYRTTTGMVQNPRVWKTAAVAKYNWNNLSRAYSDLLQECLAAVPLTGREWPKDAPSR